jgi:methionyl-tRNA formyltransferase
MRAVVLTSNQPRHAHLARTVARAFDLALVIREEKGAYYATQRVQSPFVVEHFTRLATTERAYFSDAGWPDTELIDCPKTAVNEDGQIRAAAAVQPDIVFLFGTSILADEWLSRFHDRIVNLHLGLSPYYRGSATLFWPVARQEIECVGATIHLAERRVDAGRILARVKPRLTVGDTYYDISHKTIRDAIDALPGVAQRYLAGSLVPTPQDISQSLVFRQRDFTEADLRQALAVIGDGLTADQIALAASSTRCAC